MTPKEIKQLRLDMGLSQRAFAKRLGVSHGLIPAWETGKRKPHHLRLPRLKRLRVATDKKLEKGTQ
jgi:DNA-binding transcriptional regulator YiaG